MIESSLLRRMLLQIILKRSKDKTPFFPLRYSVDVSWSVGDFALLTVTLLRVALLSVFCTVGVKNREAFNIFGVFRCFFFES